jgi:hypothetical protein
LHDDLLPEGFAEICRLLRFTFGLRTDLIYEAKDSRHEAQKNMQPERESQ